MHCDGPGTHIFQVHFAVQFDTDRRHAVIVVVVMVIVPVPCSQQTRLQAWPTENYSHIQNSRRFCGPVYIAAFCILTTYSTCTYHGSCRKLSSCKAKQHVRA